jgi:hypothetical protein
MTSGVFCFVVKSVESIAVLSWCLYTHHVFTHTPLCLSAYSTTDLAKAKLLLSLPGPKSSRRFTKAFCHAVSEFWRFESWKIRPKQHGKTPSWTTFDFVTGKVERNLLYVFFGGTPPQLCICSTKLARWKQVYYVYSCCTMASQTCWHVLTHCTTCLQIAHC